MSDEKTWAVGKIPVNDLRKVVSTLPTREVRHSAANMFILCFGMMFHLLATMNDKVCTLRPFSENGSVNDWIPQVSVIVFSVLAYVQTLRAQQLAGINIAADQFNFLNTFMSRFPLETIEIPGPLVPFFRSLSISYPGFGNFQHVTPIIPPLFFTEAHVFNMDYSVPNTAHVFVGIHMMLPNIPLMLDQFVHLVKYLLSRTAEAPRKYSSYEQLRKIFNLSTPATGSPLAPYFNRLKQSIGFWHRPTASNRLMLHFANYMCNASTAFPHPWAFDPDHAAIPAKSTPVASLFESMFMVESSQWFSALLRGMHTFNRYWTGNRPMLEIDPTSSPAGLILFKQVVYSPLGQDTVFGHNSLNKATHQLINNRDASTSCPYIVSEDFQDAQIAQVNATCPHIFNNAFTIGGIGVTRFGPFWNVSPDVLETDRGDLTPQLQSMVSSLSYFKEQQN